MKIFIDFALIPLEIKCYSILQKRLSRMLDIPIVTSYITSSTSFARIMLEKP